MAGHQLLLLQRLLQLQSSMRNLPSVITRTTTTTSYTSKFLNLPKCKVICLPATHICYTSVSPSTPLFVCPALLLPRMPVLSINILYNPHDVEYVYVSISVHIFALITLHSFGAASSFFQVFVV